MGNRFRMILVRNICLVRQPDLQKIIEMSHHMVSALDINDIWMVSLNAPKVTVNDLSNAFSTMLEIVHTKSERAMTFYMWFDEMANQLRFNVIEGHRIQLPFGARIEVVTTYDDILEKFVAAAQHGGLSWADIDEGEDIDDEKSPRLLKVFITYFT